ncbi:SDR family NAD(P)-dependent oxidoreductase [bacterium]|nr:SDR family NAD(P)-dependent oxidoreductase [bacterium]
MTLPSLRDGYCAVVFGGGGGVGSALVRALEADARCGAVFSGARNPSDASSSKVTPFQFDLEDGASIERAAAQIGDHAEVDLVFVATGVLHGPGLQPEKSWTALDPAALRRAFEINTIGPAMIARALLPKLARGRKSVFAALSARVGSISDNRLGGWHSYRASKAALNMIVRTLAIELARRNPHAVCVALHPGTVATALSAPFSRSSGGGGQFTPDEAATHLLRVIEGLTPDASGGIYAWNGEEISP